jgi:hypothetical protein
MASNDPLKDLSGATKGLKELNKEVDQLEKSLKRVKGLVGGTLSGVKNILSPSVGQGTSMGLGVSNAQFSNGAGGGGGNVQMPWLVSKIGLSGTVGAQIGLGVASAAYAGLPDMSTVMPRAAGFYNATRRMPGMNRSALTAASFSAIGGGITGPGEDVAAANVLSLGYGLSGGANFLQSMREVKGAALGYNMPNATAAMAIGGLHTGDMSANLYQYGISTLDVKTGKARTMDDIATQVYRKVYGTKKLTAAQQEFSLREGSLNRVMNDLGFSQETQSLMRPMLSQISQGQKPSLLNETGKDNPASDFYRQQTANAKLTDTVTDDMLAGYKKATDAVVIFNAALEKTPSYILQLKGAIDGVSGTPLGNSSSELLNTAKTVGLTVLGYKGLQKLGVVGKSGGAAVTATAKSGAAAVAKKAGLAGLTYSGFEAAQNLLNKLPVPDTVRKIGNIAFDTAEGAATGFAATGNPFVAIGTAVVGGGMSIKNPVQVGNKIIDQNKLPSPIQGNASENQWATDVLKKVGAPVTSENLAALTTWMRFEGGGGGKATGLGKNSANWNPLNTTQGAPGSTSMNSVGVQSYLSKDQGLDATVKTLQNGNYGQVLSALKEGKSSSAVLAAVAASPWGTFQGARDTSGASISGGSKTVNINLTIGKASEAEATAFAKRIKELLMQDKDLSSMGSK